MAELSARVAKSAEQFQDGTLDVRAKGVDQIDDQQSAQLDGGVVYRGDYFNSLNPAGAILTAVNCDAPRTAGLTAPSHPLPPPTPPAPASSRAHLATAVGADRARSRAHRAQAVPSGRGRHRYDEDVVATIDVRDGNTVQAEQHAAARTRTVDRARVSARRERVKHVEVLGDLDSYRRITSRALSPHRMFDEPNMSAETPSVYLTSGGAAYSEVSTARRWSSTIYSSGFLNQEVYVLVMSQYASTNRIGGTPRRVYL